VSDEADAAGVFVERRIIEATFRTAARICHTCAPCNHRALHQGTFLVT
jgi:hypothetical protein